MTKDVEKVILVELAKRVKELRLKKGVTQESAYNDTGVHFARIEQGKRDISYTTLYKICVYFEIPIKDFFENF